MLFNSFKCRINNLKRSNDYLMIERAGRRFYVAVAKKKNACTFETNFMRNNVIVDTLEKLTNTPYIFADDTLDENLILQNKEIAKAYALIIILCILYIIITDYLDELDENIG